MLTATRATPVLAAGGERYAYGGSDDGDKSEGSCPELNAVIRRRQAGIPVDLEWPLASSRFGIADVASGATRCSWARSPSSRRAQYR